MTHDLSPSPWAAFRKRWHACHTALALWLGCWLPLANERLYERLYPTADWVVAVLILLFFRWRITRLECPRCGKLFDWPPRYTRRVRKCAHCALWEYDPFNVAGLSEHPPAPGGA